MAKHNDMPESDSAKVFSTNLFTKEYLNPLSQQRLTAVNNIHPRRQTCQKPLKGAVQALRHENLQAQRRYNLVSRYRKMKPQRLASSGPFGSAEMLSGNSDMNGFTVYGFNRNSHWLTDEQLVLAKNVHKRQP